MRGLVLESYVCHAAASYLFKVSLACNTGLHRDNDMENKEKLIW